MDFILKSNKNLRKKRLKTYANVRYILHGMSVYKTITREGGNCHCE